MSTIFALGLHSEITNFKASENHRQTNNKVHEIVHKSYTYIKKQTSTGFQPKKKIVCPMLKKPKMQKELEVTKDIERVRNTLLTISAAVLYLVTTSAEERSNSFSSLSSSDMMVRLCCSSDL